MVLNRRSIIRRTTAALGAAALLTTGVVPAATAQELPQIPANQLPAIPGDISMPAPEIASAVEAIINQPGVPEEIRSGLGRAIGLITGEGGGEPGWQLPDDAPATSDFPLPMAAEKCIGGEGRSFGLTTSVPGPAALPLPGIPRHQLGYIFTALGVQGLAKEQNVEMRVHWVNITSGKYGTTALEDTGINRDSEDKLGTVNGTADTGSGIIVSAIEGGITADEENGPVDCNYTPSAGVTQVK